jgi:HK97 family phage portal protein
VAKFNIWPWLKAKFTNYSNIYNYRSGALQQMPLTFGQPAVYPTGDIASFIDAFSTNASIYTVVSTIANKFGYLPRYVYEIIDEDAADDYQKYIGLKDFKAYQAIKLHKKAYKRITRQKKIVFGRRFTKGYNEMEVDNPLSDLLKRPNTLYGQDSFFELLDVYYELTGDGFIWLNRGDMPITTNPSQPVVEGQARYAMPVLSMYVLPSQYIAMNVNRNSLTGEILNYIFITKNTQYYIPVEDIIHWKTPNPKYDSYNYTHLRGLSPLSAGQRLYVGDDAATDAMVAMHQNGGTKGVMYNADMKNLTPMQISALDDALDNKINNRSMKGSVVQTPGDWGYLDLSQNAVDMQLLASQDKMFSRICNLYRVNPNFFLSGQTFDNLEQARKDFITQTVMPRACSSRDEMNRVLLQAFGLDENQYAIDIDITNLPEMQDDMAKQVQALAAAWWFSPNERLEQMNEERSEDPNMDKIWIPNNLTLMDDAAVPMPTIGGFNPQGTGQEVSDGSGGLPPGKNPQNGTQGANGSEDQAGKLQYVLNGIKH